MEFFNQICAGTLNDMHLNCSIADWADQWLPIGNFARAWPPR